MVDQCLQIPKCNYTSTYRPFPNIDNNYIPFQCTEMPTEITQLPQSDHKNVRTYVTPDGYRAAKALVSQTVGVVSCRSVLGVIFSCSLMEGSQEAAILGVWELLATIASERRHMSSIGLNCLFVITKNDVQFAEDYLVKANDPSDDDSQNAAREDRKAYFNITEVNTAKTSLQHYFESSTKSRAECAWDNCQKALRCEGAQGQVFYEK